MSAALSTAARPREFAFASADHRAIAALVYDEVGILLPDGTRLTVKPLLVGRSEAKLAELAARHARPDGTVVVPVLCHAFRYTRP